MSLIQGWWWLPGGDKSKRDFTVGIAALILFAIIGYLLANIFSSFSETFLTGWKQVVDTVVSTTNSTLSNYSTYRFLQLEEFYQIGSSVIDWIRQILSNPTAVLVLMGLSLVVFIISKSKTESR